MYQMTIKAETYRHNGIKELTYGVDAKVGNKCERLFFDKTKSSAMPAYHVVRDAKQIHNTTKYQRLCTATVIYTQPHGTCGSRLG